LVTPLTEANRSAARDAIRRRPKKEPASRPVVRGCRHCGSEVRSGESYCAACLPGFREEQQDGFAAAGPAALAQLRSQGPDPPHGGRATERRAATMATRKRAEAEWDRKPPPVDPSVFTREILPRLEGLPLHRLAAASGLSLRYCALIRSGERTPHPLHW